MMYLATESGKFTPGKDYAPRFLENAATSQLFIVTGNGDKQNTQEFDPEKATSAIEKETLT